MSQNKVVVIGAGVGGLAAAIDLAARGLDVVLVERAAQPGGKMRPLEIAGRTLDAGPTVFTLRSVFEELFADAGTSLERHVMMQKAEVIARHAWSADERLDLFADLDRSVDAVAAFAGTAEAARFRQFMARAAEVHRTVEHSFIRAARPTPLSLVRDGGLGGLADMWRIQPFTAMWQALGRHFRDPRLQQMFGRYATYCGSSPFLAPAILILIAHVEGEGVWLIDGGMHRLAKAMADLARERGAQLRYGCHVNRIMTRAGRVAGVRLADGDDLAADAVVANCDVAAIAGGLLGHETRHAVKPVARSARSLSAVTWNIVAKTGGFPLLRHNVFFSDNYVAEFDDIFRQSRLPRRPTVYVCAQDRSDVPLPDQPDGERLLCLVNAPAIGDSRDFEDGELGRCAEAAFDVLSHCGLAVDATPANTITTTPARFEHLFPATGGALYGIATHGWRASFNRPIARTRVPGLYVAGGSVHPGPGIPMATLSGRNAARCVIEQFEQTSRRR